MTKADREILHKLNDTIASLHMDIDALRAELSNVKESQKKYHYVVYIDHKEIRFSSNLLYIPRQDCIRYGGLFNYYEILSVSEHIGKDEIILNVYGNGSKRNVNGRIIDLTD